MCNRGFDRFRWKTYNCLPLEPLSRTSQWSSCQCHRTGRWGDQWWWTCRSPHGQSPQYWCGSSLCPLRNKHKAKELLWNRIKILSVPPGVEEKGQKSSQIIFLRSSLILSSRQPKSPPSTKWMVFFRHPPVGVLSLKGQRSWRRTWRSPCPSTTKSLIKKSPSSLIQSDIIQLSVGRSL